MNKCMYSDYPQPFVLSNTKGKGCRKEYPSRLLGVLAACLDSVDTKTEDQERHESLLSLEYGGGGHSS